MSINLSEVKKINPELYRIITETAAETGANSIRVLDGTKKENRTIIQEALANKWIRQFDPEKWPNCYGFWTHQNDTGRAATVTKVATEKREDAGDNWVSTSEMDAKLEPLRNGCMKGRQMEVMIYSLGKLGGPVTQYGLLMSDSLYVALHSGSFEKGKPSGMIRHGRDVLAALGNSDQYVRGLHSVGTPGGRDVVGKSGTIWPCNVQNMWIVNYPERGPMGYIQSLGSGGGGNSLLGKKCHALRMGQPDTLEMHVAVYGIKMPNGKTKYILYGAPSQNGKTNRSSMKVPAELARMGYQTSTISDDLGFGRKRPDGYFGMTGVEPAYFGVTVGTGSQTNPYMMEAMKGGNTLFTNTGYFINKKGYLEPCWEGMDDLEKTLVEEAQAVFNWKGDQIDPQDLKDPSKRKAIIKSLAQGNSRHMTPAIQNPIIDPNWEDEVIVNGICWGMRRDDTVPLVTVARSLEEGVLMGMLLNAKSTAAQQDVVGLNFDVMANGPFIGRGGKAGYANKVYRALESLDHDKRPVMYRTAVFIHGPDGKIAYPGYGDNLSLDLAALGVASGEIPAIVTPMGLVPEYNSLPLSDECRTRFPENVYEAVTTGIDPRLWKQEYEAGVENLKTYKVGDRDLDPRLLEEHKRMGREIAGFAETTAKERGANFGGGAVEEVIGGASRRPGFDGQGV